jgi:hypothetical protein
LILQIVELRVFLLKRSEDFPMFTFCPDQEQNKSRPDLMEVAFVEVALAKIIKSSAKRRWVIGGQFLAILIPLRIPRLSCWWSILDKALVPRMNKNGDSGSPCLRPREGVNGPKGDPLMRMEKDVEEIHFWIQFIQIELKPSLVRIYNKNPHSILSKAFSTSILTAISPPLPFLDLIEWSNSCATIELSWIVLDRTKADWFGEIKWWWRRILNLFARILEMIL